MQRIYQTPVVRFSGTFATPQQKTSLWLGKYRLTFFFVITSILAISIAIMVVNLVIGGLAEDNLILMGV